jgi:hypothetical protein
MAKSNSRGRVAPVILGANTAQQYWLNDMDRRMQIEQRNELLDRQNTQKSNQKFAEDLQGLSEMATSGLYTKELSEGVDFLVKKGGEFLAAGINPYRLQGDLSDVNKESVNKFQRDLQKFKILKANLDLIKKNNDELVKEYNRDSNSYDIDDFNEALDFQNKYSLQDIASGNYKMPQLNRKLNREDFLKSVKDLSITETIDFVDEQGEKKRQTVTRPDTNSINSQVNLLFREGGEWAKETERMLGKAGFKKDIKGLLGTTDREEIKQTIDAYLKSPVDGNPMVSLVANKKIPNFDSPEYQSFLENATDEQLRAEKILEKERKYVTDAYVNAAKKSFGPEEYNFTLEDQLEKRRRAAQNAQLADASLKYTRARLQKLQSGEDKFDDLLQEQYNANFTSDEEDNGDVSVNVFGTVPFSTNEIDVVSTDVVNATTGTKIKMPGQRVKVIGVGVAPFDKNGNIIRGETDINAFYNKKGVTFKPAVMVHYGPDNKRKTAIYPTNVIPEKSIKGKEKSIYTRSLELAKARATEENERRKQGKSINENAVNQQFQNQISGGSEAPQIKLKPINWNIE